MLYVRNSEKAAFNTKISLYPRKTFNPISAAFDNIDLFKKRTTVSKKVFSFL